MSMTQSRYMHIRERVFFLYNILNNRMYGVWVAPKTLMSIEEIRDRSTTVNEGSIPDSNYFNEYQIRKLTIPTIIDLLPNVMGPNDLGFDNAGVVVTEIYESIQEYISLWCEIMTNAPEFKTPSTTELRYLETLAYHIFPLYKKIKPYKVDADIERQMREDKALNRRGLLGLGVLFGYNKKMGEISFVSHLDALSSQGEYLSAEQYGQDAPNVPTHGLMDSLAQLENSTPETSEWLFRG